MRLYQLSKTSGGSCCYCKMGVIKPHAPLKDKRVSGSSPSTSSPRTSLGASSPRMGSGMISKMDLPSTNQPIPNTESLQRKLSNLASIRPSGKRGGKYVKL